MSDEFDLGRYESAAGWEPEDPHKKQREAIRKQRLLEPDPSDSMLEIRPASKWILPGSKQRPSAELFGSLWREGEVAVLFGETGVGKSVLAAQISESIARGGRGMKAEGGRMKNGNSSFHPSSLILHPWSGSEARKVLYFDFELTEQQFTERYSAPSPIPGKLPIRQRFKFERLAIDWDGYLPPAFKDVHEFLHHSIFHGIERSGSRVVIIENISYLSKNVSSDASCLRMMKTLRYWAASEGLSILLIAQARHRRRASVSSPHVSKGSASIPHFAARPIELDDIAGSRHIAELADSVFAIGRSTFGDDIRYIKHLKSRNTPLLPEEGWTPHFGGRGGGSHDASNVLTYRIERMEIGKLKKQNDSGDSQLSILTSQLPPKPFLGLTYLGDAAENDHLRDYGAPLLPEEGWTQSGRGGGRARLAQSREQNELQKLRTQTSRSALIAGLMDGSYTRYLKG